MYKTRYGEMLKGGSINAEQAKIAEESSTVTVLH